MEDINNIDIVTEAPDFSMFGLIMQADAVVKSQFGDPLATGAEDAIKINKVLAQAITETDAPDYNGVNATQSWRLKRGPLRLEGLTKVSFDDDGRARIIELGVSNVNGLEVDATSAQARQALVGFLGGASSERYNAVADFGKKHIDFCIFCVVFI